MSLACLAFKSPTVVSLEPAMVSLDTEKFDSGTGSLIKLRCTVDQTVPESLLSFFFCSSSCACLHYVTSCSAASWQHVLARVSMCWHMAI